MLKTKESAIVVAAEPSAEEVDAVVRFGLSLIDFHRAVRSNPDAARPELPRLVGPLRFPDPIAGAFLSIVPLSHLQSTRLCELQDPPLPTVEQVLDALEYRLRNNPRQFWEHSDLGRRSVQRIFEIFDSFDWLPFEQATMALPSAMGADVVEVLAEFLWNFRGLADQEPPARAPAPAPIRNKPSSLFEAFGKRKGRKANYLRIPISSDHGGTLLYKYDKRTNLRRDFEHLAVQARALNLPFDVSFEAFEENVLGSTKQEPS